MRLPILRIPTSPFLSSPIQRIPRRFIQAQVNTVKRGTVLEHKDKKWLVSGVTHHTKGRGGAHYKIEMREMVGGGKMMERFNSGSFVEVLELDVKELEFLYMDHELHLIDPETYEEHVFPMNLFNGGDKALPFLRESMKLKVEFHESQPVVVKMPERGTFKVVNAPPAASSGTNESKGTMFKEAELDTGATVQVPEFVNIGDDIVVDLVEHKYVSRARS
ncbi:hypothetical protein PhCBS80983_g01938 [Powellomyces hirtus]|uniref:Translation elongation factor P n=1 Tax=Powellomyces hirtus TaxID=109895 RepID=A0A507E8I6_9FUNG|nr:hypothetical protein PhCBS80983_g01938 [Powellomyces hirtus]